MTKVITSCGHCDVGREIGPKIEKAPGMKFSTYTCGHCLRKRRILVELNGKTGKKGEKVSPEERRILGNISYAFVGDNWYDFP